MVLRSAAVPVLGCLVGDLLGGVCREWGRERLAVG